MSLPIFKSSDQSLTLMETAWANLINPLLGNPVLNGVLQKNIALTAGLNSVNHKLGRAYQGYIVTNFQNAYSDIFTTTSNTPNLTINLNSSAATTVDIYFF